MFHKTLLKMCLFGFVLSLSSIVLDDKLSNTEVVLIKETGLPARIENLKLLEWEYKLKVLLKLILYFVTFELLNCFYK